MSTSLALLAAVTLTALSSSLVTAHVQLISSTPAAGAKLLTAPTQVTITFDDELDPDQSDFTVTDASSTEVGSGTVDLTVADRNVMSGSVAITQPGVYTVTYRVAGVDGHRLTGTFSFGYRSSVAIPNPTGGEGADTAMRAPAGSPALPIGTALLLATVLVAARRMRADRR